MGSGAQTGHIFVRIYVPKKCHNHEAEPSRAPKEGVTKLVSLINNGGVSTMYIQTSGLAPVSSDKLFIFIIPFDIPIKIKPKNIMTKKAGH